MPAARSLAPACSTPPLGQHRTCFACPRCSRAPLRRNPGAVLLQVRRYSLEFPLCSKTEDDGPSGSPPNVFVVLNHWLQKDHSSLKKSVELKRMLRLDSGCTRWPE